MCSDKSRPKRKNFIIYRLEGYYLHQTLVNPLIGQLILFILPKISQRGAGNNLSYLAKIKAK